MAEFDGPEERAADWARSPVVAAHRSNLNLLRKETSACERLIHLDNAGASLMPDCVIDVYKASMTHEAEVGPYRAQQDWAGALVELYRLVGDLISADPSEVALIENSSRAWDLAFSVVNLSKDDVIVTTEYEYANNLVSILRASRRTGAKVVFVKLTETGDLCLHHLEEILERHGKHVRVVSMTHVPTHNAIALPVAKVGAIVADAKRTGIVRPDLIYMVDACQSIGQRTIDVRAIGCDVLTFSARKFLRGPRGIAVLYFCGEALRREIETFGTEPFFLNIPGFVWDGSEHYRMHSDNRCFESWEGNYAAKLALRRAVQYYSERFDDGCESYMKTLAEGLRAKIGEIRGLNVEDVGEDRSASVTCSATAAAVPAIAAALERRGINVGVVDRRVAPINMARRNQTELIKISVHNYISTDDLDHFIGELDAAVSACARRAASS